MRCLFYRFYGSSAFYPLIRVLPSYPRFTFSSVLYPHIRVLPSCPSVRPYPLFTFTHTTAQNGKYNKQKWINIENNCFTCKGEEINKNKRTRLFGKCKTHDCVSTLRGIVKIDLDIYSDECGPTSFLCGDCAK